MDKDEKAEPDGASSDGERPPPPSDPPAEPPSSDPTYEDARAALELQQATPEAEATEVTPSSPGAAKQPRARGRPRKGKETGTRWTCPKCGKNLSSRTKKHVCPPAQAPEPAPSDVAQPEAPPPLERSVSAALPAMTLEDVTRFLYGEVRSRRNARRERINAQMF